MNRVRTLGLVGLLGAGAVALAACSAGTTGGYANAANNQPAASSAAASGNIAEGARLTATTNATLGTLVEDGHGMTLYRFNKDQAKPTSVSNCNGQCASEWPPVLVNGSQVTLSGVDSSAVGTVTRSDGTKQLTIGGWPVYEYAGDTAPGQTNGQGVGGTWYAVTPQGGKAVAQSGAGASTTNSGGSGYGSGYGTDSNSGSGASNYGSSNSGASDYGSSNSGASNSGSGNSGSGSDSGW